ncbi:Ig-like domain-containing protein [Shewanella sp. A25]|nr:Ig-like domain-containing protein [Shewanella shenzhenensis]
MRNILLSIFAIMLTACGGSADQDNLVNNDNLIKSIQISAQTNSAGSTTDLLPIGFTLPFKAIATYADNSVVDVTTKVTWRSSVSTVASIDRAGLVSGKAEGQSQISAMWNGVSSNNVAVSVTSAVVMSIQISAANNPIPLGTSTQLTAIATFSDNTNRDVTAEMEWFSSDASVVSINNTGVASGLSLGMATLWASMNGVQSNELAFEVSDAIAIKLQISPAASVIALGTQTPFTAIVTYSDGRTQDVTESVVWNSASTGVATIDAKGVASAVSTGNTVVSATFQGVSSNNASLTVTAATVTKITVTPGSLSLPLGVTEKLTAIAQFSDGSRQDVSASVQWTSSAATIASIDQVGLVRALLAGSATIQASLNGVSSDAISVTVSSAMVSKLQISPAKSTISKGTSTQFTAVATFSDNSVKTVTNLVSWISSDTTKVLLSASGLATGVDIGGVTVRASLNGVDSNQASITVTDATVVELVVSPGNTTLAAGLTQQYKAVVKLSDGTSQDITEQVDWQSSDLGVATISTSGLVDTVAKGTSQITASFNGVLSNVAEIVVSDAIVTDLQISALTNQLGVGTQAQFTAVATFSDDSTVDVSQLVTWNSDNSAVLSVSSAGVAMGLSPGSVTVHASYSGVSSNNLAIRVSGATLTALQVTPATSSIAEGGQTVFTAIATYSDGTNQDVTTGVAWQSSDTAIVTINQSGIATGVNPGTVTIFATLNGVASNNAVLTITNATVTQLQISPVNLTLAIGATSQFKAVATYSDNTTQDVTKLVSWSSSAVNVGTISVAAVVRSIAVGEALISANFAGVASNKATLRVTGATLSSIVVSSETSSIAKGSSAQLTATATYSDGSTRNISSQVTWKSSSTSVATISSAGLATGQAAGSTNVSATLNGVTSNSLVLGVTSATVTQIQVSPAIVNLSLGGETQLTAVATYSDGTSQNLTSGVAWNSADTSVATVTSSGRVAGVTPGSTTIVASYAGVQSNNVAVTISSAMLSAIQLTPASGSIAAGTELQFTAVAWYSDNSSQDITTQASWNSSDTSVATVVDGLVSGDLPGATTITASFNGVQSNSANLTVTTATLSSIVVTSNASSIAKGTTTQFTATATYSDGSTQNISSQVNWASSATAVATISGSGLATGQTAGTTNISATKDGVPSNTLALNVTAATVTQLQVSPSVLNLAKGVEGQLTVVATYSDGTTQTLTSAVAWSSANTTTATVSTSGKVTGVNPGNTTIVATYNGVQSNSVAVTITAATVSTIQLTPASASLAAGTERQFTAIAWFSDGSSQDITTQAAWSSSDTNVATVLSGLVSAVTPGSSIIQASFNGEQSNSANLTVTAATISSIAITSNTNSIAKGTTAQFTATATYSDGSTQNISSSVSWNSSATAVATVSSSGLATGQTAGTTNISATKDGVPSNTLALNVTAATVTQLQVSPSVLNLAKGVDGQLTAVATYSDGTTQTITSSAAWTSANSGIATVTTGGKVTGVNSGNTTIVATFNGVQSNSVAVTISAAVVSSIQLTPSSVSIASGTEQQFTAVARFSDNSTQDITSQASWSSSDTNVATVLAGLASGENPGTATIQASFNGVQSNSANLTVTAAVISSLQIVPGGAQSVPMGTTVQLQAIATYSDGSTQTVSNIVNWNSSNTSVATVSSTGLVTGVALGTASITASKDGVTSNAVAVTVTNAMVTSVQIFSLANPIAAGTSTQFTAAANFSDGSQTIVTNSANWTSSSTSIATISASGVATGVQAGSANIRATYQGVSSNTIGLTVTAATLDSIAISTSLSSFAAGTQSQLTAVGTYSDGSQQNLTNSVSWASSNNTVVSINTVGRAFGNTPGTVTVSASMSGVTSADLNLTVTSAVVTNLAISSPTTQIVLGNNLQFTATATYSDASTQNVTNLSAWTTSATSVATINTAGLAQSVAVGVTNIRASYNGVSSNIVALTVNSATLQSLRVEMDSNNDGAYDANYSYINLLGLLGQPPRIFAVGTYSDGTTQNVTTQVTWVSSDAGLLALATDTDGYLRLNVQAKVLSHEALSATLQSLTSENFLDVDCLITVPLLQTSTCTVENKNF